VCREPSVELSCDRAEEPGTDPPAVLSGEQLRSLDAYWREANYLSVGQIYLLDNPLLRELELPDFRDYAVEVSAPTASVSEPTQVLGELLRDAILANPENLRIVGADETASNRLGAVFEVTNRAWDAKRLDSDDHLAPDGRVMEILSEHLC